MDVLVVYFLVGEVKKPFSIEFSLFSLYFYYNFFDFYSSFSLFLLIKIILETRVIACRTNKIHHHHIAADTDKLYKPPHHIHLNDTNKHEGLNLLYSLSIGGNDLLGSSLYTAGIVAAYAGKVILFYSLKLLLL